MGIESSGLRAAITKNIDQSLTEQNLTRNALSDKAGIPKSTLYRNLDRPERFKVFELGQIAAALGMPLIELITDDAA
jgi:predicted transcriptional regulator